jgi:hypothetical protein
MDLSEFARLKNKKNYSRHPWEIARKNVLLKFLKNSNINFPINRIVDIGSGDAFVIHTLIEQNIANEYFAIDIEYNEEVISQLIENNNNSKVIYFNNLKEYFSKVTTDEPTLFLCMDVLEHLENENEILELLNKGNNYYFFAVPAFQNVFSDHDVLLGHYRRYTLNQLKRLLEKKEFKIIDNGYYFTSLLVFRWIDKLINKDKKASIDNWEGGNFKSKLITNILKVDFFLSLILKKLGIIVPGLSCYCLCKK